MGIRNCLFRFGYFTIVMAGLAGTACHSYKRNNAHPDADMSSITKGKVLADQYCKSCHLLPDPALLDAGSWEKGVLPHMGPLLGIQSFKGRTYPADRNDRYLDPGYYPAAPLLNPEDWGHIVDYYT